MGEYPAAVPENSGQLIIGELYRIREIDEMDWAMAQLDDYEGLQPESGEEALYRRDRVSCRLTGTGETTEAWIYWYNGETTGRQRILSGDVLQYRSDKKGN